jgi:hypothetical protein
MKLKSRTLRWYSNGVKTSTNGREPGRFSVFCLVGHSARGQVSSIHRKAEALRKKRG